MAYYTQDFMIGMLLPYGGTDIAPSSGWLMCDGTLYDYNSNPQYKALFDIIRNAFGTEGGTTFRVPDMRGMFLRGVRDDSSRDPDYSGRSNCIGGNTGNAVGSRQNDAIKNHTHPLYFTTWQDTGSENDQHYNPLYSGCDGRPYCGDWTSASSGSSETRPRNVYVNFIIKY